ncbi:MAG: hypothetical protein K2Y08_00460 [Alphaproteobacteria bacterium]|nr:hypothetical protein [Alphaproteobacteria bacterium]
MKNLILTTVSVLALSAFAVQAAPENNMNDQSSQPSESQNSSLATDGTQAATGASSSSTTDTTAAPSASSNTGSSQMKKPMAQHHGTPHAKHHGHHGEHPAKHHGKHHGKHHPHMGHPQYPNQANIGGVFVTFPPMDLGDTCRPEFYTGRTECPYVYHGGYFWYPHVNATMLNGYTPSLLRGMYWYPSYMHPYAVYTQRAPIAYTLPYVLSRPLPSDSAMYKAQTAPMRKKWDSAPEMQPGQVN